MKNSLLAPKDLRSYQWKAFWFAFKRKTVALFMDMGLGKTIVVLSVIKALLHKGKLTKPVLIIAPIRVIYGVWRQEAAQWKHTRSLKFSVVHGSQQQRLKALDMPADIYLMNVHNLRWLLDLLKSSKAVKNWPFGMLVIDESSMFKAAGTKRFGKLRHFVHLFDYRIILSGTPTPNNLLEIWPQMYIVDCGERLGTAFTRFKARFFAPTDVYSEHPTYAPRQGADRYIHRLIKDVALSMEASDWLDVPPTVYNDVFVELPPSVRALYDRFERELFLELDKGDVDALNAASLSMRCHQIANGAVYSIDRETEQKIIEELHREKIEALRQILDETGSPVLVAYHFKHDLMRLREEFPYAPAFTKAKDDRLEREWNAGEHPVVFAHYQNASHGMNLQHGPGHTIALFSLTWSYELYSQFISRIGEARAQRKVTVHHIRARSTVDDAIMLAMEVKAGGNTALINALKRYRRQRVQALDVESLV